MARRCRLFLGDRGGLANGGSVGRGGRLFVVGGCGDIPVGWGCLGVGWGKG